MLWNDVAFGRSRLPLKVVPFRVQADPIPYVMAWTVVNATAANTTTAVRAQMSNRLTSGIINPAGPRGTYNLATVVTNLGRVLENNARANVVDGIAGRRYSAPANALTNSTLGTLLFNAGVEVRHNQLPILDYNNLPAGGGTLAGEGSLIIVFSEVVQPAVLAEGTIGISGGHQLALRDATWIHNWLLVRTCNNDCAAVHHVAGTSPCLDERNPVSVAIFDLTVQNPGQGVTTGENSFTAIGYPELVWFGRDPARTAARPWFVRDIPDCSTEFGFGSPYAGRVIGAIGSERMLFQVRGIPFTSAELTVKILEALEDIMEDIELNDPDLMDLLDELFGGIADAADIEAAFDPMIMAVLEGTLSIVIIEEVRDMLVNMEATAKTAHDAIVARLTDPTNTNHNLRAWPVFNAVRDFLNTMIGSNDAWLMEELWDMFLVVIEPLHQDVTAGNRLSLVAFATGEANAIEGRNESGNRGIAMGELRDELEFIMDALESGLFVDLLTEMITQLKAVMP
jgi:hypothetical protein